MTSQHKGTISFVTILLIGLSLISLEVNEANALSSPENDDIWPVIEVSVYISNMLYASIAMQSFELLRPQFQKQPHNDYQYNKNTNIQKRSLCNVYGGCGSKRSLILDGGSRDRDSSSYTIPSTPGEERSRFLETLCEIISHRTKSTSIEAPTRMLGRLSLYQHWCHLD